MTPSIRGSDSWSPDNRRHHSVRHGLLKLLAIKDSDIRLLTLEQCRTAVDKGLHAGGAFSATVPLVSLFYGGFLNLDVADPTRAGQDMFVLSKGHAVAALASIYAELGYIEPSLLRHSRSDASVLNGHPGPLLPGVAVATGPMGQGLGVAQGFAIAGRASPRFDSYALVGDGEMQEGSIWETVMYAGQHHLGNFCALVDRNYGQLDVHTRMVFPMPDLEPILKGFGWKVWNVDATDYEPVVGALEAFRYGPRTGQPTAIICHATKGHGACSDLLNRHKVTLPDALVDQEMALQLARRRDRVREFAAHVEALDGLNDAPRIREQLFAAAREMHLDASEEGLRSDSMPSVVGPVLTRRARPRDKRIQYEPQRLPVLDPAGQYSPADVVTAAMKVFACDRRVVSVDADLATTSGLEAGVAAVDQSRALNAGVAEANMMLIGEAFAALGRQVWISTFCPFFDWKVLRRVAVGHQERLESIASPSGWLSDGHGLDLTCLATAANFETRTNGATHMGNDDSTTFDAVAHLRIIDVSCPQQLLAVMKWIMEGNRGLVYVRVMRTSSAVLYGADVVFEFGKAYVLREAADDAAVIVTSGRQVHEALQASARCAEAGIGVGVVDMPSIDEAALSSLVSSGKLVVVAEQNNGYIWDQLLRALHRGRRAGTPSDLSRVVPVNTLAADGRPWFIQSATYEELVARFRLTPAALAETITEHLRSSP